MTAIPASRREIPQALQQGMAFFRSRVRRLKLLEVCLMAAFGLLAAWLAVFALDRVIDTPGWLRALLLAGGTVSFALLLPAQAYRWVWGTRRFDQVARVMAKKDAATGDRLLGVIELSRNDEEFRRSPVLCEAAIHQVDEELAGRDPARALPDSRHRGWAKALIVPLVLGIAAFAIVPDAASNAARRFLAPFGSTPRFTFARVQSLPAALVVAKGEPVDLKVELAKDTAWSPSTASASGTGQADLHASLSGNGYVFHVPPLTRPETLYLGVGDYRQAIELQPVDRPSIATLDASVKLPDYLGIPKPRAIDSRAGLISVVAGSKVSMQASTTRELTAVTGNGEPLPVSGREFTVPERLADQQQQIVLEWTDVHGLHGQQPMNVSLRVREDEAPTIYTESLRNETVLLVSDTLTFQVHGHDDFGVRKIGLSWETIPDPLLSPKAVSGEKLLTAAQDGEQEQLTAEAAFCPELLGVPAEPIKLSAFVEDAFPGRARVSSVPMTIYVMTPEQHMIWLTKQLTAWDDEAREVHERELALYDENLTLRAMSPEDLDKPANRRRIENQVRGERANAQRLSGLLTSGRSLLAQAARNPEFNANMLDQWAEMMRALQDIAASRMPSVANLLASAAQSKSSFAAGVNRLGPSAGAAPPVQNVNKLPGNPAVVDNESTMITNKGAATPNQKPKKVNAAPPPLRLASTTLQGKTCPTDAPPDQGEDPDKVDTMTDEELAKACEEQRKLLEEFARLQGDISKVIAALTGSTFVKRLKAESREQGSITGAIRGELLQGFGRRETHGTSDKLTENVMGRENRASSQVSNIQDDLGAFVDRLQGQDDQKKFKSVLDEMRTASPSAELVDLGHDVKINLKGEAVVGTEFWSDKFDYWAELLVGPG